MLAAPLSGLAPLDTVTSGAARALRSMASALFVYRFSRAIFEDVEKEEIRKSGGHTTFDSG